LSPPTQPDGRSSHEAALELIRAAVNGDTPVFEWVHRTAGGADIRCEVRLVRLPAAGLVLVRGSLTDITERNRVYEALRESEERFGTMLRASPFGISISTLADGRFIDVNDGFLRIYDCTREEIIGRTSVELGLWVDPRDRADLAARLLAKGRLVNEEKRFCKRTGGSGWALFSVELIELKGQKCIVSTINDITERKWAEMALKASEEGLRASIENTPNVAVQWYDKHGRVLYWNRASENIFGWKSEEALGKTLDQLLHTPEEAAAFVKLLEEIQTTGQSLGPREYGFRRRDGASGTCLSTTFAIPSPDGAPCFVCMDVDVTERYRAEEQIQQAYQQLRELTAQLEASQEAERKRIARELHDEFGGQITALRVDLTWLSRKSGTQGNGVSAEEVAQRLKSMTELVDTLARSTRRIAGALRPSILDDLGLVAALRWQTRDFQERTGLECTLLLGPDVAQMQVQDSQATALFRIAQELLTNVTRHANAQRVQIGLQEEHGALVMTIDDDGRGIMEEDMSKPTSFGLRGIRERVALIGGELTMKGVPHRGTTVGVRVPISQQR